MDANLERDPVNQTAPDAEHERFMRQVIELARQNIRNGRGGPFAAAVVKDGIIIARGTNQVTSLNDPTAHAEVIAIREACRVLGSFQLSGCDIYTSCEPCPMCLGAIYWARPVSVYFAATREDAAAAGFDDSFIYDEFARAIDSRKIPMTQVLREEARGVFTAWEKDERKVMY